MLDARGALRFRWTTAATVDILSIGPGVGDLVCTRYIRFLSQGDVAQACSAVLSTPQVLLASGHAD